jgi:hypothetical protein
MTDEDVPLSPRPVRLRGGHVKRGPYGWVRFLCWGLSGAKSFFAYPAEREK